VKTKFLLLAFCFFLFKSALSAPVINIVRFNNTATYYPGGSISIHINPTGVFALNNTFTLELSDASGNFTSPTVLATVNEFFTPLINATIPAGTPTGAGYRLRVRASTTNAQSATSSSFSIGSAPSPALITPAITPQFSPQTNCLAPTQNPPYLGWLNISSGVQTQNRIFFIPDFDATETYTVTIVDLFSSSGVTLINPTVSGGAFTFPSGKPTGYYTIEIERKKNVTSTIKGFVFQHNTGNTNLGNSSNETVCSDSTVQFTIDTINIKYNYPLSTYTINFGDGSPAKTYTHAQLLDSLPLKHIYNDATCQSSFATQNGSNGRFYKIDIRLFNKGLQNSCQTFTENGNGTTKWANAGKPPEADFTVSPNICINTALTATNTSTPGQYGTGLTCDNNMFTIWKVKKPGDADFSIVASSSGLGKLNLTIPANQVNVAGCWVLRLEVNNVDGCPTVSIEEKTIGVSPSPIPGFKILKSGVEVTTICNGESVTLNNESNLVGVPCQSPTYSWTIIPNTGFTYIGGTNSSSSSPQVTFNTPGNYTITQNIINSCGTFSVQKTLTVNGAPTVTIPSISNPICKFSPADTVLDFSLNSIKPTFSSGNFTPSTFLWEVNGSSTPNADWSFSGGTTASSQFPKIQLKTFRSYSIKVTVDGGCGNSNATYTFDLRERPKITNSDVEQRICSGAASQSIALTSSMTNTTYTWTTSVSPAGSVTGVTAATSGATIPGSTLTKNTSGVGTVTFAVTATNNGCSITGDFKVFVHPIPANPATSPVTLCINQTASALTATALAGHTLSWYTAASGGTGSSTAPTPSTASAGTTTYYVSQVANTTPNCESNRSSLVVTVNPLNTAAAPSANPTLCVSQALSPSITIATTGATGIGAATGLPTGVTANWNNNTITISGTPSVSGTFNYSIPLTGGCGNINATGTITVNATNTASAPSANPSLCVNTALQNITINTTGATGIGTVNGLPAGVTASWNNNTITISGTPSVTGTFNYSIQLTGGCGNVNATGTITVVAGNTASTPAARITCVNAALSPNITINTGGATGIGAATGLPAGFTANWNNNVITISGTPTATGVFNYSIPLTGGCGTVNATGTITVNEVNTAAAPSATPSVCISAAITPITIATTGATGIGTATGLPTGVTASWNNNTITISGTPTTAGTFNYSIPLNGGCGNVSASGTITVLSNTVSSASSNPSVCINTALSTDITFTTTGAAGIGTPNNLPAGLTATWNNNTITITGTPTAAGTFNYSIPLTGGCGNVNATGTITVIASNTASSPATKITCVNVAMSPNITITTGGATGIGSPNNFPAGLTASWNNNMITISGTPTATGTFNYTIPLTGGCGNVNATGTITVNATNTAAGPSANPTVCINSALTPVTIATTSATGINTATGLPAGVTAIWNNNTITISGTPTVAGAFNYSIPLTGGCGNVSATGTITVLTNTVTAASATPSICINTALSPDITFTTTGATGIGAPTNLPAGLTATWNNNTITISGTPTATGTFNYTIPLTGGCGTVNATGSITVVASNTATSPASRTLCINTALSPNITITTTGATGIGAPTDLPAGVTAAWSNNTITISGTPTVAGTFNYSIPLTGGCGTVNATGTITVNPSNTATAPSDNPTLCINSALVPITIATTSATGIGTPTGLPAGVTSAWSNNTITISGTPSVAGTFNYSIPLTGGCGNVNATGTITVLTNTVTAASATPSICINTALSPDITFTTTGATGIGGPTNLPAGLNATWNNNTITISGTPTATGTFNYTIPLTGGCGTVNATGSVTVVATNTAATPSANPTLCINTALTPSITIATTGATGIGAATGLPAGLTATWNNNIITISGTPTEAGSFNYTIPLTGGCGTVNANGTISVTPANIVASPSATPALCINSALTPITIATTGATGIGAATGLPAGVTATWNNDVITISGTPTNAGTFNYSIPLTGGCGNVIATGTITVSVNTASSPAPRSVCVNEVMTPDINITTSGATGIGTPNGLPAGITAVWNNSSLVISGTPTVTGTFNYTIPLTGGCGNISASGTITVIASNTVTAPASQSVCINTPLTAIALTTTGATGIGAATGLPTGVTATWNNNIITISGSPSVAGTFNYSIPLTGGCGTVAASGTITVIPNNTASAPSSTPTLCINTPLTDITFTTTGATGIGAPTNLPAGLTATWNNNVITISGTPTASGTFNYAIPLTGGCGAINATGTITVTANNTAAVTTPRTICINTALTPDITIATTGATGIGTPNNLPAGLTATWNNNTITISGTATASGTFNYSIPLTGGCGTVNATGMIEVTAANTVAAPSSNPTLCINSALTPITIATSGSNGIGAPTGLPTGVTASFNNNTITISGTPSVAGTFNYSIPLTGGCGSFNATGTITVLINTVTPSSVTPSLCINSVITPDITFTTTLATGIGTATGLPPGVTATWNNNTITISGTPTVAGIFNYSIPLTGGCGVVNAIGVIDVKPRPVVQTMTTTICSGQTFTLLPTNGNGNLIPLGTTYTWSAPVTTGGITGVAGNGNNISGTLMNSTTNPQTATYTVTPSATNCPGNDFTVIVTVNPTPTISFSIADQTSCSGSATQPVTITSPTPGAVIQWNTTFPAGITATPATTSGTNQIPSYTFTNSTTAPVAVSFVTTVSTPGTPSCPGPGGTYTITVYPTTPPPVAQPLVEYCHNDVPSALTATATAPNTLLWYTPTGQMSTTAPIPSTATVGSFIYFVSQVSPTTPACESVKVPIEVKIKPIPQIAVSAVAPTTCNSNNGVMTITGLFANTSYELHYVVNNVTVNTTINTNAAGNIVVNNLVGGIYRNIWVVLNGCPSNNVAGPFNLVNPDVPATPTTSSNSAICEGATLQLGAVSLTPNVTYEWTGPNGYTSSLQNPLIVNAGVNRTGRYKVVARANGCVSQADSIDVVVHPNPTVDLGPDLQVLPPSKQVLTPVITNGPISQYTWTPSQNLSCTTCPNPTATVLSSITYKLTVRNNNGCIGQDDVHITAICAESIVYIPNAFVPNGGANSIFRIKSAGPMMVKHFRIFNRWGELIFERDNFPTNDATYGWDGRINGTLSNPDVFVYTAEVMCDTGATLFLKGNVTLLR
jgi:hypothetical protein